MFIWNDGIDMTKYLMENYIKDINQKGLKRTWQSILSKTLEIDFETDLFTLDNYGELYETGLEHENKISKIWQIEQIMEK